MPGDFPNPRAGQTWSEQSARQFRNLSDEVRRLKGLIDRSGLNIPSGAKPKTFDTGALVLPQPKTVVIVVKPLATDAMLTVREAKYADLPPSPCTSSGTPPVTICHYTWHGPAFAVWPPLGKEAVDYAGDEYVQGSDDIPPKLDTVFHRCHREHDSWVLDHKGGEGGGGGIVPARVLSFGTTTINIQRYKWSGSAWVTDRGPDDVLLWGSQIGSDFSTLVGDMIPLVIVNGEEFALQYFWMYTKTPNTSIQKGDCDL